MYHRIRWFTEIPAGPEIRPVHSPRLSGPAYRIATERAAPARLQKATRDAVPFRNSRPRSLFQSHSLP